MFFIILGFALLFWFIVDSIYVNRKAIIFVLKIIRNNLKNKSQDNKNHSDPS